MYSFQCSYLPFSKSFILVSACRIVMVIAADGTLVEAIELRLEGEELRNYKAVKLRPEGEELRLQKRLQNCN